ncbi:DNA polymerase III subunit gamma/tau [Anaerolentibacter hominis]|uniref:DNA polymerase III subunit gamma/tau n=1 Tax=Anaerolentibacter hominis TaxID=3079009 RepID=UPI0031B89F01
MSYTALYRKFRPKRFEDVKGQEHIVTTLKNQIAGERIGHAYLFCGTRGTGKTTIAKIFARAVNCEHPVDGSPCGECETCRNILNQTSMNVIEIDAASNNGVDNIREIIDEVQYSPTEGKYKVYIIDEVHMLSTGAFNALLKTLEEPPSYVIFILATTEVHKIPITILSRCQRYDFKRITIDTIAEHLKELLEKEQVEAEEKAVRYIAKMADGSMRDALSLLDQCIAFYFGKPLTYDNVLSMLGTVDSETFGKILLEILQENVVGAIELLEDMIIRGIELDRFVQDFTWFLRNILLLQASDQAADMVDVPSDQISFLKQLGERIDSDQLMRYIRVLSEASGSLRYASQKRVLVEMTLIKLCRPQMESNYDSLLDRVRQLEEQIERGVPAAAPGPAASVSAARQDKKAEAPKPVLPAALSDELKAVAANWQGIVARAGGVLGNTLTAAVPSVGENNTLMLVFSDGFDYEFVSKEQHIRDIEQLIADAIQKTVVVQTKLLENREDSRSAVDITKLVKNVPIEFED